MLAALVLILCTNCELPAFLTQGAEALDVDVELVLAVDVSGSMDESEFALQRAGYVEALRHADFVNAVLAGRRGRIAVTYFEWAGSVHAESLVPWQIIDDLDSANRFAGKLALRPVGGSGGTSISSAVIFGATLIDRNDLEGEKRVIDISGDRPNNSGVPVQKARDTIVSTGIIINGLPILLRPTSTFEGLDRYYTECVTGGPGSFVLPIHDASEFATAIRHKLILEISGPINEAEIVNAQAKMPFDCLVGERYRLIYPDL